MDSNYPDPSDSASFYDDPAQAEPPYCIACGDYLEPGDYGGMLICPRCEPEEFVREKGALP